MHRDWKHEASVIWLMARRACLTASDVKKLIPDYKRVKAGKIELSQAQQFAKVYGDKKSLDMDPMSYGPAARGHVLEPHAVDEFMAHTKAAVPYHWWDDRLIVNDALGFSPDALDIEQIPGTRFKYDTVSGRIVGRDETYRPPEHLIEVKCYEAGAYYQRMEMAAEDVPLDERWQLACAMAVCPTISIAHLMFYAPQCRSWFYKTYDSSGLFDEIETVNEIGNMWLEFKEIMDDADKKMSIKTMKTEQEIYETYLLDNM